MADGKKIVLITGANTGIGYEAVKALLQSRKAYFIYLGSRSIEKGNAAIKALEEDVPTSDSTIELLQIDIESDDSITAAFEQVKAKSGYIDVLINNAGMSLDTNKEVSMREAWTKTYDVNVSGTQVMTYTFVPLLLKSFDPRVLFLTSGLSTLQGLEKSWMPAHAPTPQAGWPKKGFTYGAYRSSKAALNMMMLTWFWMLKEDGVKVWCLSPGMLATDLGGIKKQLEASGAGHPSIGGNLIRKIIEGERDADVGKVVNGEGVQPF